MANSLMNVATAAMQTAMAIKGISQIGKIWSDDDLSAGEKLV